MGCNLILLCCSFVLNSMLAKAIRKSVKIDDVQFSGYRRRKAALTVSDEPSQNADATAKVNPSGHFLVRTHRETLVAVDKSEPDVVRLPCGRVILPVGHYRMAGTRVILRETHKLLSSCRAIIPKQEGNRKEPVGVYFQMLIVTHHTCARGWSGCPCDRAR